METKRHKFVLNANKFRVRPLFNFREDTISKSAVPVEILNLLILIDFVKLGVRGPSELRSRRVFFETRNAVMNLDQGLPHACIACPKSSAIPVGFLRMYLRI